MTISPKLGLLALLALTMALVLPNPAFAEDDEGAETEEVSLPWVRNVAEAKAQAAREGKDLVINFTGSDWCGWCMKLDEEVFDHAEFVNAATQKFVFVYLDFPRSAELKEAVVDAELNQKLQKEYGVQGFPTIIITTADGTPYGRTGYQKGGPEGYMKHLEELKAGGEKVKKMLADTTHADTECLKEGFQVLADANLLCFPEYANLMDAAEKADPDGSLGLKPLVAAERNKALAEKEQEGLRAVLPQARGEEPDWTKVAEYLLSTKFMKGPQYLNIVFTTADKLIGMNNGADAVKLLESAKRDELITQHERAKEIFGELMQKATDSVAGGEGDEEDHDEGGDEHDGGEHK